MKIRLPTYSKSHAARRLDLAAHAVAVAFDVEAQDLKSPTRGEREIALARQIAMYVAHVALGVSLNQIARGFGRDRTTARHACKVIEDRREEPAFDEQVRSIESALSFFRVEAGILR